MNGLALVTESFVIAMLCTLGIAGKQSLNIKLGHFDMRISTTGTDVEYFETMPDVVEKTGYFIAGSLRFAKLIINNDKITSH